ncbi:MAG: ABC transporter ATP-binding protein [bacterium]
MNDIIIKANDLTKEFPFKGGVVKALRGIDIEIRRGELLSIMGPSGSGKSTLMNILGCLDRQTAGSYILEGEDVNTLTDDERAEIRKETIGFVFQSYNLLPKTSALKNVAMPMIYARVSRRERHRRAEKLLDMVGLSHRIHHLPSEMSGGERQRVSIARSLANDPDFILADEPTGNLDSHMSDEIMDILANLNEQGKTIVIVTHEHEVASKTQRIVHIRDGKVHTDASQ